MLRTRKEMTLTSQSTTTFSRGQSLISRSLHFVLGAEMVRSLQYATCVFMLYIPSLQATDLKPWFPRYLEIQSRFSYLHQYYSHVSTGSSTVDKMAKNDFYTGSIEVAYDTICGELESTFGSTGSHHLAPDDISGTFRYLMFDDVVGDPVSVAAGVSLTGVFTQAFHDISTFYHGRVEGEFHLSVGKEVTNYNTWDSRAWGVAGIGLGDHGSPWLHLELAWEKNWCERQQVCIFSKGLFGLGHKNLDLSLPFRGYGSIRYQAVDLGASYQYFFPYGDALTLGYAYRVHAKNCPKAVSSILLSYLHPFGL